MLAKKYLPRWRGETGFKSRSPENKMLAHLPIIILTSLHLTPVADSVPKFEIARECQFEGGTKEMRERCVTDESQARDQLQTEWAQFTADAKAQCYEETNTDSTPSYVEFLTCLEMARDVKNAQK
jgi:hypothetical protein